jgi:hypothetical protein
MRLIVSLVLAVLAALTSFSSPRAEDAPSPSARTARLEGTVSFDRHRRAVGTAVVASTGAGRRLLWLTTTDGKGFFVFDRLPEGAYRVEVRRDGFAPVVKEKVELRFPFRAVVEVTLVAEPGRRAAAAPPQDKRIRLSGKVTVRGAGPLPEARLRLVRSGGGDDPRSVLTRRDGTFALADIPAGTWRIEALGAGYLPVRADLDLSSDASLEAVLVPQPASYVAPALDMLPQEEPIPPPGL